MKAAAEARRQKILARQQDRLTRITGTYAGDCPRRLAAKCSGRGLGALASFHRCILHNPRQCSRSPGQARLPTRADAPIPNPAFSRRFAQAPMTPRTQRRPSPRSQQQQRQQQQQQQQQ
jgi:hypothetical protein